MIKHKRQAHKTLSILLAIALLCSLLPGLSLSAAAAEDPGEQMSINNDTLRELGLDTSELTADLNVNPYGKGVYNMSVKSELVTVSSSGASKSYSLYDGKKRTSDTENLLSTSARAASYVTGSSQLYTQIAAFDLTGSGKKDHIAQLSMDKRAQTVMLGVYKADTGALVGEWQTSNANTSFSEDIPASMASSFLAIVAGDFNGDGFEDIAFTRPRAVTSGSSELYVCYANGSGALGEAQSLTVPSPRKGTLSGDDSKKLMNASTLSLAVGDLNGDGIDDLAIASNIKTPGAGDTFCAISVFHGSTTITWNAALEPVSPPSIATRTVSGNTKYIRNVTLAIGDIDGDGRNELLAGGHSTGEGGFIEGSTTFRSTTAVQAPKLCLTHYSYSGTAYQSSGIWLEDVSSSVTAWTSPNGMLNRTPSEPLACVNSQKQPAQIFFGGKLFSFAGTQFDLSFDFAAYTKKNMSPLRDWPGTDGLFGNDKKKLVESIEAVLITGLPYSESWISAASAGNFLNNDDGSEDIAFIISSGSSSSATHTPVVLTGSGDSWKFKGYASSNASSYGLAAADIDNDGILLDYQDTADYYFSDPQIIAVLQAAPRFKDLDGLDGNYATAGSTAISKSSGSGTEEEHSFSVTAGIVFGFEYEPSIAGVIPLAGIDFEAKLTASVGGSFTSSTETTHTVTYTSESDDDRVALVMTPYTRYYYRMYIPAFKLPTQTEYNKAQNDYNVLENWLRDNPGTHEAYSAKLAEADSLSKYIKYIDDYKTQGHAYGATVPGVWQDHTVSVPDKPRVTMISVDQYDRVATLYKGMSPIYGSDVLGAGYITGEPGSYRSTRTGLDSWSGGKVVGSSGSDFLTVGNNGGSMSQSIDVSSAESDGVTWGTSLETTLVGKGALLKSGITAGVSYEGGYGWTSMSGSTVEGTVANLPNGSDGYKFSWQFGSYQATTTDEAGVKKPVTVLGYLVNNVNAPPSLPVDVHVSGITDNSITLGWLEGLRPAMQYEVYRMVNKKPLLLATLDGSATTFTDTACNPDTEYTYLMRSVGSPLRSIMSAEISETTNPAGAVPTVSVQDETVRAGTSAKLTATVSQVPGGNFPIFQWQKYESGRGWVDIANATAMQLTIPNATKGRDDGHYRCVVNQLIGADFKKVYSQAATLTIDRATSTTIVTIGDDETSSGFANGTKVTYGNEEVTLNIPLTASFSGDTDTVYQVVAYGTNNFLVGPSKVYVLTEAGKTKLPQVSTEESPLSSPTDCHIELATGDATEMTLSVKEYTASYMSEDGDPVTVTIARENMSDNEITWSAISENLPNVGAPEDAIYEKAAVDDTGEQSRSILKVSYTTTEGASVTSYYLLENTEDTGDTVLAPFSEVREYSNCDDVTLLESELLACTPVSRFAASTRQVTENTSVTGAEISLTAKVSDTSSDEKMTATGTVEFSAVNMSADQGLFRQNAPLENGTATVQWTPAAPGLYRITATYSGDSALFSSVSGGVTYYAYLDEEETRLALDSAETMVYGSKLTLTPKVLTGTNSSSVEVAYTVMLNGETISHLIDDNKFTPAKSGSYLIRASYKDGEDLLTAEKTITVTKKAVTVTAKDQSLASNALTAEDNSLWNKWKDGFTSTEENLTIEDLASNDTTEYYGLFTVSSAGLLARQGNYPIAAALNTTAAGYADFTEKYSVSFVPGQLTVTVQGHTVSFSAGANGQISATYISPGNSNGVPFTSGSSLPEGSNITFTAIPSWGQKVSGWTVNGTGQASENTMYTLENLQAASNVTVVFTPRQYPLTFDVEKGTSVGSEVPVNTIGSVSAAYTSEAYSIATGDNIDMTRSVTLTAAPAEDYLLEKWVVNGTEHKVGGTRFTGTELILSRDDYVGEGLTVQAYFTPDATYEVTLLAIDDSGAPYPGSVTFTGAGDYAYGSSAPLSVSPGASQINEWRRYHDGGKKSDNQDEKYDTLQGNGTAYTIPAISADWDVRVVCQPLTSYTLTFSNPNGGTLTAKSGDLSLTSGGNQPAGIPVTFTVEPEDGYLVKGWTGAVMDTENPNHATISSLMSNTTVSVILEKQPQVTIPASANGSIEVAMDGAAVSSGDYVPKDSELTVVLKPNTGYEVGDADQLTGLVYTDGSGNTTDDKSGTLTVAGDMTITPTFTALDSYQVTFSVVDTNENGTLSASVARKNMAVYTEDHLTTGGYVYAGSTVTFTAAPEERYQVKKWTVGGEDFEAAGTGEPHVGTTLTLTPTADTSVTVEFEEDTGRISFVQPAQGSLNAADAGGDAFVSGTSAEPETEIIFTYEDSNGNYEVAGWLVNGELVPDKTVDTFTYSADGSSAEIAVSVQGKLLTIDVSANAGGTVSSSPSAGEIRYNDTLILTATPNTGYVFAGWLKNGGNAHESASYNAGAQTAEANYKARFEPKTYTVSYSVEGANGTISVANGVDGAVTASHGDSVTFTVMPEEGFMIGSWKVDGAVLQSYFSNTLTLTIVTDNTSVTVSFEEETLYSLPAGSSGAYAITNILRTPSTPGTDAQIRKGGTAEFTVSPVSGKQITALSVMGVDCLTGSGSGNVAVSSSSGSYTITVSNVTADVTVSVLVGDTGGGGGGGGGGGIGGGGGGGATPAPKYEAGVSDDGGSSAKTEIAVDTKTGSASAELSSGQLKDSENPVVTMPRIPDVTDYSLRVPTANLSESGGSGTITFDTEAGRVTFPSNMLAGMQIDGETAQLTIGAVNATELPAAAQAAVGNHPVVSLSLTVDGKTREWNNPNAPVAVRIPYTPTAAELERPEAIVIWYIDGAGNISCVPNGRYDAETGTVSFITTHFSNYAVSYNRLNFSDVNVQAWYAQAVSFIAAREITTGTGDGKFSPDAMLSRGQFITMLLRAYEIPADEAGADNFADAGNTYYTGYLAAAKRLTISNGVGNNKFAPEQAITRQEMFTLLYNALKAIDALPTGNSGKTLSGFTDSGDVASWANEALAALVKSGTVSGSDGKLEPKATTTRAQMAQVLYNLLGK